MIEDQEPLAQVLLPWWSDTLRVCDADADELELAQIEAIEELDRRHVARSALLVQHRKELADLQTLAPAMRRALGLPEPPEDAPDG